LKERLRDIFAELERVLLRTRPHAAALEETFAGVNMKSAIAMGEGRGIALLCLARAGVEVLELSPRSIKQAVTGSGAAGKARVAAMVAAQLDLKKAPEPEDVTDALAAAIALARRV
jgi:crossover junction endodeoxyribonuclease RuvC